jgi:DNA-binding transcriptional ArsR family regulator
LSSGAENIGKREVQGSDILLTGLIPTPGFKQLKIWGCGSLIMNEEDQQFDSLGNPTRVDIIGNLAHRKVYLGISGITDYHLSFSFRSRFIGERQTVLSNPVRSIGSYFVTDGNIIFRDVLAKGINLNVQVSNIFNAQYYHPGTRSADAGTSPGHWQDKAWIGSQGLNNSLMPQPGRVFQAGLQFSFH